MVDEVVYVVDEHRYPSGWAVYRQVTYRPGIEEKYRVAIYKTEGRAKRVAAFLNAVLDQGDEVGSHKEDQ